MKKKQLFSVALATAMVVSSFAGCSKKDDKANKDVTKEPTKEATNSGDTNTDPTEAPDTPAADVTEFTAWFAVNPSTEVNDDSEIKELIAAKTGVKVKETWLVGQEAKEAVGTWIAGGEYPDFMEGSGGQPQLLDAEAFIPLNDYIYDAENYPNLNAMYSKTDWEKCKQADGNIYYIPQFGAIKNEEKVNEHNYEAFWIQARVLKQYGYPKLETLAEYFDLIERFMKEGEKINGIEPIGLSMMCTTDVNFAMENPPMFLAGYPNDGACIVDVDTLKIVDYNTMPVAKEYFKLINEKFKAGVIDPECFTQTRDEYIAKLSAGNVLGICDQWWYFSADVNDALKSQGLDLKGCNYIPTAITLNKGDKNQWATGGKDLNVSSGIGITVSCKDPDKAAKFLDDLLSDEIQKLRFWGVEGVDYYVDDAGVFHRTPEQRLQCAETGYKASHMCPYSYFPQFDGTFDDGINATKVNNQPEEFYDGLSPAVQECFTAYGVKNYVDLLGNNPRPGCWYPMWTFSNSFSSATPGGTAWTRMKDVRLEWLPKVIMSDNFDADWDKYMEAYAGTNPEDYLSELQTELDRRIQLEKDLEAK